MVSEQTNGERPAKRAKLLLDDKSSDDGSDVSDVEGTWNETEASAGLKINEEYAKKYEYNKKREERHKLEEKYDKKDNAPMGGRKGMNEQEGSSNSELDSDSESQSEDDDGLLITETLDAEIMSTLKAIQSKDPRVYDKNSKFYNDEDLTADSPDPKKQKEKPIHLQDYHRQNLLAGQLDNEDDPDGGLSYVEEQNALKRQLVDQMHVISEDENGDDTGSEKNSFLTLKRKTKPDVKRGLNLSELDVKNADRDPETFLSNFMAARAWIPSTSSNLVPFESDDEEEDKKAEAFEEGFNLRFEDPDKSNTKLLSHSREAAAKYSVRREEPKGRRKAREEEQARKLALKAERDEEKGRLRNLKIEEAQEKLQRFKEAAGLDDQDVSVEQWAKFLESGWDSDNWDQEMMNRFGEKYYAEKDHLGTEEVKSGSKSKKPKKPKFLDDINIEDIIPDFNENEIRMAKDFTLSDDEDNNNGDFTFADETAGVLSKKEKAQQRSDAKRRARKERQKLEQLVDARLTINAAVPSASSGGAGPSAFHYRATSPSSFGLSTHEILMAEDAQLNQFVGLKKLAPFRDADKKRRDRKRLGKKARLRQWRQETFGNPDGPQAPFAAYLRAKLDGEQDTATTQEQSRSDGKNKNKSHGSTLSVTAEHHQHKHKHQHTAEPSPPSKRKRRRQGKTAAADAPPAPPPFA